MISLPVCGKGFRAHRAIVVLVLSACFSGAALAGSNITGTVHNGSRGQAAAGDDVMLLRLDNGLTEARARTDDGGAFTLAVQSPDTPYLVRVLHQDVTYDQRASSGDELTILVFDAAQQVQGITGSIEIVRAGTNGKLLHVSDMIEIKNESSPPRTLAGERTFEAYLPATAKMDSVLAAGSDKTGVMIRAAAVSGEPGHYVLSFPLRPGATKLAFNYDLPYDGHAAFETRHAYPLQQLAVMIPSSMRFRSRSAAFQVLITGNSRYQVRAANQLVAGNGPAFEVSGVGELPPFDDQTQSLTREQPLSINRPTVTAPNSATLTFRSPLDSGLKQTQPPSQTIVIGGLTAVLTGACALLFWRARKPGRISRAGP
jgi:hypothetical protein